MDDVHRGGNMGTWRAALEENLAAPTRLRDMARHYVALAAAYVQLRLDAGHHPHDAVLSGLDLLEAWALTYGLTELAPLPGPLRASQPDRDRPRSATAPTPTTPASTTPRTDPMSNYLHPFDDRTRDSDVERIRSAAEHFIDVVRNAVRAQLQERPHDPHQAMLRALDLIEAWLVASGELDDSSRLVRKLDELFDTLDAKLPPDRQLTWLREPTDILSGLTPIEAVVGHRINAVLAAALSLPETPASPLAHEAPPADAGEVSDSGPC